MIGLDYDHLWRIYDKKGREAWYSEKLKIEFYEKKFTNILSGTNAEIIKKITESNSILSESNAYNKIISEKLGGIEDGLSDISDSLYNIETELYEINSELGNISGILEWGFSGIIENQRISQIILGDIARTLRIPDFEIERLHQINRAIKFQKEAFIDPALFETAIKYYEKALELAPEDYFVLTRLGFIYLHWANTNHEKAKTYFETAFKYASPEFVISIQNNNSTSDITPSKDVPSIFSLKEQVTIIAFYVGYCNFLLGNHEIASEYFKKAFTITPSYMEARYYYLKTLLVLGVDISEMKEVISIILNRSPLYFFKFKKDLFFQSRPIVNSLIEGYIAETVSYCEKEFLFLEQSLSNESPINKIVSRIKVHYQTGEFLGIQKAFTQLRKSYTVVFSITTQHVFYLEESSVTRSGLLRELVEIERDIIEQNNLEQHKQEIYELERDEKLQQDKLAKQREMLFNVFAIVFVILVIWFFYNRINTNSSTSTPSTSVPSYVQTASTILVNGTKLFDEADSKGNVLAIIDAGATVITFHPISPTQNTWIGAKYNGIEGYIRSTAFFEPSVSSTDKTTPEAIPDKVEESNNDRLVVCNQCNGTGFINLDPVSCSNCAGAATNQCQICRGGGTNRCTVCLGNSSNCSNCNSTGWVACKPCGSTGWITCKPCNGLGRIRPSQTCPICNGEGELLVGT